MLIWEDLQKAALQPATAATTSQPTTTTTAQAVVAQAAPVPVLKLPPLTGGGVGTSGPLGGGVSGTGSQAGTATNAADLPVPPYSVAAYEMDPNIMSNIQNFQSAGQHVTGGHIATDPLPGTSIPYSKTGLSSDGSLQPWSIDRYVGGKMTPAQNAILFEQAISDPDYRTALTPQQAAIAAHEGWTAAEWRILQKYTALVGTAADPGNAPLGNDGLPTPGPGGTGAFAPPPAPAPAPAPAPKPLAVAPSAVSARLLLAIAAIIAGGYLLMACKGETQMSNNSVDSDPVIINRSMSFSFIDPISQLITGIAMRGTNPGTAGVANKSSAAGFVGIDPTSFTLAGGPPPSGPIAQKLAIARKRDGHRLNAITLDPRSAYSCFDVWTLTDGSVEALGRVDIANPLMFPDLRETDDIWISVPNNIPQISVSSLPGVGMWDGVFLRDTTFLSGIYAAQLRLQLWYGAVPLFAPAGRPLLHATARENSVGGATSHWFVPVEGRRRIRITALTASAVAHMTVNAYTSHVQFGLANRIDDANFTAIVNNVALAANVVSSFVFDTSNANIPGCPLLDVQTLDTNGGLDIKLDVYGFDN